MPKTRIWLATLLPTTKNANVMKKKLRQNWTYLKRHLPWLLLILALEGFSAILLWLADVKAFQALLPLLLLSGLAVFILVAHVLIKVEKKREKALRDFLQDPTRNNEKILRDSYKAEKRKNIDLLVETLYEKQVEIERAHATLTDYEDYVELWAHEIKLPLSLLTLVLDNQEDSLPPELRFKLDYVRSQVQNNIAQILFYYRVRSEKKDYFLEKINLGSCLSEILEDYGPLIREKNLTVNLQNLDYEVYTDRRAFDFMIGQAMTNTLKYSGNKPCLDISARDHKGKVKLTLEDNGQGVKECDLPYIFEKAFTGDSGEARKKSTGMGLYLVKELADDLHIDIAVSSKWQEGFTINFSFPQ